MEDEKELNPTDGGAVVTETVETTTVSPEGNGEEAAPQKSHRDTFKESMKGFYPDADFDNEENGDEEMFRSANEMIAALQEKGNKYDEISSRMLNRFKDDASDAQVMIDWLDGDDFVTAVVKNKGEEALSRPNEGDEGYEAYQDAIKSRKEKHAANEALAEEIKKNIDDTIKRLDALAEKEGWTPEEKQEVLDEMFGDLDSISKGNFTDGIMGRYVKARNHDKDVEVALEQGRADGRNEKINAERKRMAGSGLPNSKAGAGLDEEVQIESNPTADWLGKFSKRK